MHLKIHEDGPLIIGNFGCNPIYYHMFSDYLKEGYKWDDSIDTLDVLLEKYNEDTYENAFRFDTEYVKRVSWSWYFFYKYIECNYESSSESISYERENEFRDYIDESLDDVEKFFKFAYHYLKTKSLEEFQEEYAQYISEISQISWTDNASAYNVDLYVYAPESAVDTLDDLDSVACIYKDMKCYENDLMRFVSYLPQASYIDYYDFDDEWDPHVILNGKKYGVFTADELDKSLRYNLTLTQGEALFGEVISIKRNNQNLVLLRFGKYSIVYDLNDVKDVAKIRGVVGLNKKYFSDEFYEFIMRDNLIVELKEARDYYYKLPKLIIEDSYDDYIEPTVYYNIDAPYDPDDVNLLLNDDSE